VLSRPLDALSPEEFSHVLQSARNGLGSAWETIYRALAPAVAGYLRGQGAHEPDDLTSEVFLALVQSIERFAGSAAQLRTFVFVIAHHRLTDERRRTMRRKGFLETRPIDALPERGTTALAMAAPGDAAQTALDRLSTEHVEALCESLAPDQRDVVLLRIVADLSIEQVADVLGKSPGAVKALQHRAFEQLRRKLTAPEPEAVSR
jgi:RNA polymerase sigma factor (sigma-70 family)